LKYCGSASKLRRSTKQLSTLLRRALYVEAEHQIDATVTLFQSEGTQHRLSRHSPDSCRVVRQFAPFPAF